VLVLCDFLHGSSLHTTRSGSFHNYLIAKLFGVGMYMWLIYLGLKFIYWEQHVQLRGYHDLWNKFCFLNILLILLKYVDATIASGKFYSLSWVVDVFMFGKYFSELDS
jgi:hypothetical protein